MSAQNQTDIEIETLVGSYKNLQDAREKFSDSLDAIQVQRELPDDKSIMVPLTGSMYVVGHLKDPQNFLIDIGTHYMLEKNADGATDYFERKLKFIDLQLAKFSKLLDVRMQNKDNPAHPAPIPKVPESIAMPQVDSKKDTQ